jgi:PAS domain S-box-containing protein
MKRDEPTREELIAENKILRERLLEAEQTFKAIRNGEVDALVIRESGEEQIFTLKGADHGYRILVESINEGALIFSSDNSIYYCNHCFGEMIQIPTQKIIGTTFNYYIDQSVHTDVAGLIEESRSCGSAKGEFLLKRDDGTFLPVNLSLNCVDLNDFQGVCAVVTDLSRQKQFEKTLSISEAKYRELIQLANSIIMRFDINSNIIFANEYAQKFFGYTENELLGRSAFETIVPDVEYSGRDLDDAFKDFGYHPEKYENFENENIRKGGERVWVSWTNQPIYDDDGHVIGVLSVGNDITDRKKAEDELRSYAARLESLNKELQEFAFIASHDLQEPLRKIHSFGDMLGKRCKDKLDATSQDYLMRMKNSADRMRQLLSALLNYSRLTTRCEPLGTIDLRDAVMGAISDLELKIERAGAIVDVSDLPTIEAEPSQMRQLFQNLIGNALKFQGKAKPQIRIYSHRSDHECRIFVEDNGIGFDEQYLDRIFAPFQRLHGRGEYEGTGMGLAICRKIVERYGGKITAKSTVGKGSTFIVTFPVNFSGGGI